MNRRQLLASLLSLIPGVAAAQRAAPPRWTGERAPLEVSYAMAPPGKNDSESYSNDVMYSFTTFHHSIHCPKFGVQVVRPYTMVCARYPDGTVRKWRWSSDFKMPANSGIGKNCNA